jgi:hypothetical protein
MRKYLLFGNNKRDTFLYYSSYFIIIILAILGLLLTSCGDDAPTEYIQQYYVEGYLIVGEPIRDIKVMKTLPVTEPFSMERSLIRDAQVKIIGDGQEFNLYIEPTGDSGYYLPDVSYLVKPETEYSLEITLSNGTKITGSTKTSKTFEWVQRPKKWIQYPIDTANLPGVETMKWSACEPVKFFYAQYIPLDTLNYGKYLPEPTNELNRRVYKTHEHDEFKNEPTTGHLVANTESSIVWMVFKYYGLYEVVIYAPDAHLMNGGMQNSMFYEYQPLLENVVGAAGFFGSGSVIRDTIFLLKNQP